MMVYNAAGEAELHKNVCHDLYLSALLLLL